MDQTVLMIGGIVLLLVLMILPQWQARRRRQKQMQAIDVGTEILTVGGIIGKITYLNRDENRARIEIAPGVEIQVVVNAISQPLAQSEAEELPEAPPDEPSEE
jgi:preprotein translocase subunit YajC